MEKPWHSRTTVFCGFAVIVAMALAACGPAAPMSPNPSVTAFTPVPVTPGTGGTTTLTTTITPKDKQPGCQNLENRLYLMTTAKDPATYAADNRLSYVDGKVRVVVELKRVDESMPSGYDINVETRQGDLVQALVPVGDLCRVSNEPQVRFVRAPIEPVR